MYGKFGSLMNAYDEIYEWDSLRVKMLGSL